MVIICTIANIMKLNFPRTFSVLVSYDIRNNRVISLLIFNRLLLMMGTDCFLCKSLWIVRDHKDGRNPSFENQWPRLKINIQSVPDKEHSLLLLKRPISRYCDGECPQLVLGITQNTNKLREHPLEFVVSILEVVGVGRRWLEFLRKKERRWLIYWCLCCECAKSLCSKS